MPTDEKWLCPYCLLKREHPRSHSAKPEEVTDEDYDAEDEDYSTRKRSRRTVKRGKRRRREKEGDSDERSGEDEGNAEGESVDFLVDTPISSSAGRTDRASRSRLSRTSAKAAAEESAKSN